MWQKNMTMHVTEKYFPELIWLSLQQRFSSLLICVKVMIKKNLVKLQKSTGLIATSEIHWTCRGVYRVACQRKLLIPFCAFFILHNEDSIVFLKFQFQIGFSFGSRVCNKQKVATIELDTKNFSVVKNGNKSQFIPLPDSTVRYLGSSQQVLSGLY